jgi:8-oxo-dGTP pyrophosphatase MutT (NUDIX family)
MQRWKTLSRRTVLDYGKFLTVEEHKVRLSDGRVIEQWPWVITPDYVNILAITEEDEFLCFRQTKYAIDGLSLAPVGGYLESGEEPLEAAQRELLEETGYQAATWTPLGSYVVDANRGAGTGHMFIAHGARKVDEAHADDLEKQELLHLTRSEVEEALATGQFKVLPWAALVALALCQMNRG